MISMQPQFVQLGDSALVVQWGNVIDFTINKQVTALAAALRNNSFKGLIDIVPAYSSLTLYYDVVTVRKLLNKEQKVALFIENYITSLLQRDLPGVVQERITIEIPVCYDPSLKNDLELIAAYNNNSVNDVINLHHAIAYHVYMLGFLPGFAYMGTVDERIAAPRKQQPVKVAAGAVAIAGRQTGIYPVDSPGGWHVVGYTPLKIFDATVAQPFLLNAGDSVRFIPIDLQEYHAIINQQSA